MQVTRALILKNFVKTKIEYGRYTYFNENEENTHKVILSNVAPLNRAELGAAGEVS